MSIINNNQFTQSFSVNVHSEEGDYNIPIFIKDTENEEFNDQSLDSYEPEKGSKEGYELAPDHHEYHLCPAHVRPRSNALDGSQTLPASLKTDVPPYQLCPSHIRPRSNDITEYEVCPGLLRDGDNPDYQLCPSRINPLSENAYAYVSDEDVTPIEKAKNSQNQLNQPVSSNKTITKADLDELLKQLSVKETNLIKQVTKNFREKYPHVKISREEFTAQMAQMLLARKLYKRTIKVRKDKNIPCTFLIRNSKNNGFIHLKEERSEKVSQGNFKIKYEAIHVDLSKGNVKLVAHQKVRKEKKTKQSIEETKEEIKLQQKFKGEHFVQIHDVHCEGTQLSIYAELCEGTLESVLEKPEWKNTSLQSKKKLAKDFVLGLQDMHKNGQIHNDIKADNLLISDGRGKIIDFGLVTKKNGIVSKSCEKNRPPEWEECYINQEGEWVGTEQTDIFQMGIVLYQMFYSFKYPRGGWHNTPQVDNLDTWFNGWQPQSKEEADVKDMIRQCLSPNPKERPTLDQIRKLLS